MIDETIIAQLTQRIPELPPSSQKPRDAPEKTSEASEDDEVQPEPSQRRSWLRRFFFGP